MNKSESSSGGTVPAVVSGAWLGSDLLVVAAGVRYWEDATINGAEDIDGTLVPHRFGELWKPVIELETGKIRDWPQGTIAHIHYKVCDAGEYWLADAAGKLLWKYKGDYVPDDLLCIGDHGYGDYIILNVGPDGMVVGWRKPEIDKTEWSALPNDQSEPPVCGEKL